MKTFFITLLIVLGLLAFLKLDLDYKTSSQESQIQQLQHAVYGVNIQTNSYNKVTTYDATPMAKKLVLPSQTPQQQAYATCLQSIKPLYSTWGETVQQYGAQVQKCRLLEPTP